MDASYSTVTDVNLDCSAASLAATPHWHARSTMVPCLACLLLLQIFLRARTTLSEHGTFFHGHLTTVVECTVLAGRDTIFALVPLLLKLTVLGVALLEQRSLAILLLVLDVRNACSLLGCTSGQVAIVDPLANLQHLQLFIVVKATLSGRSRFSTILRLLLVVDAFDGATLIALLQRFHVCGAWSMATFDARYLGRHVDPLQFFTRNGYVLVVRWHAVRLLSVS